MKINLINLFIISITIFVLKNEITTGKVCYQGSVSANWQLRFKCNDEDVNVTEVNVETCYLNGVYYTGCYLWDKMTKATSLGYYHFKNSTSTSWGTIFYAKIKVNYDCPKQQNSEQTSSTCHYWVPDHCYSCRENKLIPCHATFTLNKSDKNGGGCYVR
uniref:Secreted protein n=1 Tax=Parastrongyloides trichosuri TaxID=131310 RepID=A0A0N4Z7R4_PARTI